MDISRKIIHWTPSEKDPENDSKEQEPVRKVNPVTKRISLTNSTDPVGVDLEVGDEEEPVYIKGIYKDKNALYFAKCDSDYVKKC